MNCITSREAGSNLHKQADEAPAEGFTRRGQNSGELSHSHTLQLEDEAQPDAKRARLQKELTFQDMYQNQDMFDQDDDDDSDWEPFQLHKCVEVAKWFCKNCTMVNVHNVVCCEICGEHKDSKILSYGYFASPFAQDKDLTEIQPNIKGLRDVDSQESAANSSTAIGFDERMLLHAEVEIKSHPHPERPDRLRAIAASLARAGIFPGRCYSISAREITQEELMMVHSSEHIESVEVTSELMSSYFTSDTYANEHSACAARLAAGLCADLASAIVSGHAKNGFALVRPPGHHAGVRHAMGFCLHNNAAVAASAAQAAGARKVLILDWDVHHGNGTQEIFEQNKSVLYISLHRHEGGKFYPGTGAAHEVGSMGAEGYCVNIPWSRGGVGDNDYSFAFQHVVLPIASEFAPDFTIISAGFDAARGDPLGCCDVTPSGYAQMTHMLNALSGGKLLVILEGGYNLRSISSSATAVIKVLLGESPECELENSFPTKAGLQTVLEVLNIQMNFWPSLGPIFKNLQSQWRMYCLEKKSEMAPKMSKMERAELVATAKEDGVAPAIEGATSSKSTLVQLKKRATDQVLVPPSPIKPPALPSKVMKGPRGGINLNILDGRQSYQHHQEFSYQGEKTKISINDFDMIDDHVMRRAYDANMNAAGELGLCRAMAQFLVDNIRSREIDLELAKKEKDNISWKLAELRDYETKIADLEKELARTVKQKDELTVANSKLHESETELKDSKNKLQESYDQLLQEKDSLSVDLQVAQASIATHAEQINSYKKYSALQFKEGFNRAIAQAEVLAPGINFSPVDFCEVVKDGMIVEEDEARTSADTEVEANAVEEEIGEEVLANSLQ